jgi:hypothetical protein
MRALYSVFTILGIVCAGSIQGQTPAVSNNDGVLGAWELVSYKYGEVATATDLATAKKSKEIKLMTKGHFVWVVYDLKKRIPSSSGGGTYRYPRMTTGNGWNSAPPVPRRLSERNSL